MSRFVKVPSNKAGPFTAQNNRVEFDLEMNSNYDLSKSYINFYCSVDTPDNVDTANPAVYLIDVTRSDNSEKVLTNIDLVKNCHMRSSKNGMLEDIRDVDNLKTTLREYTKSTTEQDSENYKQVGSRYSNVSGLKGSIFREIHKEGTVTSRNLVQPIRIRLDELFSLGSVKFLPTDKLGRVRIHTELNLDKIELRNTELFKFANREENTYLTMEDKSSAQTVNSFTTFDPVLLIDSPFWVGQKVQVKATASGGAPAINNNYANIVSIIPQDDGTLQINLDRNLSTLTSGQSYTDIQLVPVQPDTQNSTFTCEYAEMVVAENENAPSMDVLEYTTFTTEQFSAGDVTNFQKIFQVEPNAVNLMVFTNDNSISINGPEITNFRIRVDNVDVTDRNVEVQTPLYYDLIAKTLTNAGLPLKNLNEYALDSSERLLERQRQGANRLVSLMTPLNLTEREKNVQLNINSDQGLGQINLYKQVIRTINL